MQEGCIEFVQYVLRSNKLPAVFEALPSPVSSALGVTRPSPPTTIFLDVKSVGPELYNTDVIVAEALPVSSHLPYSAIAVQVREPGHSRKIAR